MLASVVSPPSISSTSFQRGLIAAATLALLETAWACGTGAPSLRVFPLVILADFSVCMSLAAAAVLIARLLGGPSKPGLAEGVTTLVPLAGIALIFALRGAAGEPPLRAAGPWWMQWGITGLGGIVTLAGIRPRGQGPVSHGRFLVTAGVSFSLAIVGVVLRTMKPGLLDTNAEASFIPLIVGLAAIVAFLAVRRVHDSWPRVVACSLFLTVAGGAVVRWGRPPTELELGPAAVVPTNAEPVVHGVLVVTLDTARRDRISMYGRRRDLTPSLQRFAERATVFENAYACASYTLPSHASLFTGLLPSEHGTHAILDPSRGRERPLSPRFRTMAEEFAARGYQTGGIAANMAFLAKWTGLSRGFGAYVTSAKTSIGYYPLALPLLSHIVQRKQSRLETWPGDTVTAAAIRWMERYDSKPFFLFINYMDVHQYLDGKDIGRAKRLIEASPAEQARFADWYDESVHAADSSLGRLLTWMSSRKTFDRTLIVITSDHGEYLGERYLWGHGNEMHENVLRIPLVVKFPGAVVPGRTPRRINHAQLHSLILQAAQGKTLSEIFPEPPSEPQVVAEMWQQPWAPVPGQRSGRKHWTAARAVYGDGWKLIQKVGSPSELYHLAEDPEETVDLFESRPEVAAQRASALTAALPPMVVVDDPALDSGPLSAEAAEQLRALGYAGP